MVIRHLKILFVALVSLLCLFYAVQNVVNLDACYQTFAYVAGGSDQLLYPGSFFPAIDSPALIWSMLVIVVGMEFAGGILAAKGTWDMWSQRAAVSEDFNKAKTCALLGCGVGIIVWFGLFGVFGGAMFQMWQTAIGGNSMDDAFQFFVSCALIFLIVERAD